MFMKFYFTLADESRNPLLEPAPWASTFLDQSHAALKVEVYRPRSEDSALSSLSEETN